MGPLFEPWAELLLNELELGANESILDVACGTGIVARKAHARQAAPVVGTDVNPEMLEVAKAAAPNVEWRHGDAVALPLADGEQFDAVVCQQGLQFVGDKLAALKEMKRAMRVGGKLGIAIWRSDEEVPIFRKLREVAETTLGPIKDARHDFAGPNELQQLAEMAGMANWTHVVRTIECEFPSALPFLKLNTMALIGMSGKELNDQERAQLASQIEADSQPVIAEFSRGETLVFESRSNLFLASG